MRKFAAVLLIILLFLIAIPGQLAILGYAILTIVSNFQDNGILSGFITIFLIGFIMSILETILFIVVFPFLWGIQKTLQS